MEWHPVLNQRARPPRLLTGLLVAVCAWITIAVPLNARAAEPNEFANPSWSQLPEVSAYNTTPSCPVTEKSSQCTVAPSAQPPADPNNPERYLNSAYWPAEKRPDIEEYAIQEYGYQYQDCTSHLPHYCFLLDAEAVGYPVTHTPEVGDLWLAPCSDLVWKSGASLSLAQCEAAAIAKDRAEGWYLGYVEAVLPDGSFIQSWGGSAGPPDSGLSVTWFSAAMVPNTDFIGFMPPGTPIPKKREVQEREEEEENDRHAHTRRLIHPHLRLKLVGKHLLIKPERALVGQQASLSLSRQRHDCWMPSAPSPITGQRETVCGWRTTGKPQRKRISLKRRTLVALPILGRNHLLVTVRTNSFSKRDLRFTAAQKELTIR